MPDLEEIREWLTVPPSSAERGVRRCTEGHLARSLPAPCPVCGGATVGLAFDRIYSGEEDLLVADVARREKARRAVFTLVAAVWVMAALRVLTYLVFDGALRALIVLVTSAVIALVLQALLALGARVYLEALRGRATHGAHIADLRSRLESFAERILEPFLARNAIAENAPVRPPADELALLEQAFAHEDLMPRHGSLAGLVAAAALRRDLRRFRERLVAASAGDWFLAYARTTPDDRLLPLLEEVLFEEGLDPEGAAEQVRARRSGHKLEGFLADLEQRRGNEPVVVTVDALDAIEPASFEALVLMLLETEGYERRERALERHGEKTAFAIRQHGALQHGAAPLDTPVVQETLVAKAEAGCERGLLVTNGAFTEAARTLAASNAIELVDRDALAKRLEAFNRASKDYGRLATLLRPRAPTA